jgi:5'-methylthioinosine phosphorylase
MPTSSLPERERLAIIGGSGLYSFGETALGTLHSVSTPFGSQPVLVTETRYAGRQILFLPRHGEQHTVPPHLINYRANLWALQKLRATTVVAVNAVGGIAPDLGEGHLLFPDQLIDYTHGREATFGAGGGLDLHQDFTEPYSRQLTESLANCARRLDLPYRLGGVYGCTQGPRLETAAEIRRMANEGCDVVGMTGMPEAILARELGLHYSCIALVVNRAAGLQPQPITASSMQAVLATGMQQVRTLLASWLSNQQDSLEVGT